MGTKRKADENSSTDGMSDAKRAWIRKRVKDLLEQAARTKVRSVSDRTELDRAETVARVYRDLWALGYRMEKVEALAPRHLVALVQGWKARGLKRETARVRWTHLRLWCVVLGKPGMAPTFPEVWPEETAAERESAGQKDRKNRTLQGLSEEQYRELLEVLKNERSSQTGYWLVRCIRELKLKREEAFLFEPARAHKFGDPTALVWGAKGRDQRAVDMDTPEKVELVADVRKYLEQQGRNRLGWAETTLAQMTWRYKNLLIYAMKHLKTVERVGTQEHAGNAAPESGEGHAADEMKALLASWPGRTEVSNLVSTTVAEGVAA